MAKQRSLKPEYALYVEREIEEFKNSLSRSALLAIGDEAAAALGSRGQAALIEVALLEEVDRLIAARLRLPSYATWCQRRRRRLARLRNATRSGLDPDGAVAGALREATGGHVLLAGAPDATTTLYAAAHGCDVTVLVGDVEVLDELFAAADYAGVGSRVRGCVCGVSDWEPDVPLRAVLCTPDVFGPLTEDERARALSSLVSATPSGGVHIAYGDACTNAGVTVETWRQWHPGWTVSSAFEARGADGRTVATIVARRSDEAAPST